MTALAKTHGHSALAIGGAASEWEVMVEQAKIALDSGFLPRSIQKPAQAIAVAMAGRELGLPLMTSFRFISIIEGKPGLAAEGFLALAYQKVPGFGHQIVRNDEQCAEVQMWRPGMKPTSFKFSIEDAKNAGLAGKDVWRKYGTRMLLWRAIKWGVQTVAPDATLGMKSVDEIEEISESDRTRPGVPPVQATVTAITESRVVEPAPEPPTEIIDEAIECLRLKMDEAQTEQDLKKIGAELANTTMTEAQSKDLRAHYAKRRNKIRKTEREAEEAARAADADAAQEIEGEIVHAGND